MNEEKNCCWASRVSKYIAAYALATASCSFGYVPEPQPVKSKVEISALYYPGTDQMAEWDMVRQTLPQVKPLLGWYDEGNPEVVDWQIKWAVEHGISSFGVDWYWDRGVQRLDHWIKAYHQARWRKYLKWYIMYANHNTPGAHSKKDQEEVTRFWIENYFCHPEYLKIDGKPVVVYFRWQNVDNDFIAEALAHGEKLKPGEGVRRAFAISDALVKKAGYPGIHYISMAWQPEFAAETEKTGCFSEVMTYDFWQQPLVQRFLPINHPRKNSVNTGAVFEFQDIVDAAPNYWSACWRASKLPFWPGVSTGWDERPRTFEPSEAQRAAGRTVARFKRHCQDVFDFCVSNGVRRIVLGPVNEWQEGNYIEPSEDYGFGMYDAVREVFCEKPETGWPKNIRPSDVGCGPYDFPPMEYSDRSSWDFNQDGDTQGWYRNPYGAQTIRAHGGVLEYFRTQAHKSPAGIRIRMIPFSARRFKSFSLRLRLKPDRSWGSSALPNGSECVRLYWGRVAKPIFRNVGTDDLRADLTSFASVPAICDGKWHEYELPLEDNPEWVGSVNELWFDASRLQYVNAEIDWMRLDESKGIVRDDLLQEKMVPFRPGATQVGGEIGRRCELTLNKMINHTDVEATFVKHFRERKEIPDEPWGFAGYGMFLDAIVKAAACGVGGDVSVKLKTRLLEELAGLQDESGRISMFLNKVGLWDNHECAYMLQALCLDHRWFGCQKSLETAVRLADSLLQSCSKVTLGSESAFVLLTEETGDLKYIKWLEDEGMIRVPLDEYDRRIHVNGTQHVYTWLARSLGQLQYADCMGVEGEFREELGVGAFAAFERLKGPYLSITGSCSGGAQWGEVWDSTQAGLGKWGETCATAYLMRLSAKMLEWDSSTHYGDVFERAMYNAFFSAQSQDGLQYRYFTPFEEHAEWFGRDTYCCPNNFKREMFEIPNSIFYCTETGVAINLYAPAELKAEGVYVKMTTDYPDGASVVLDVTMNKPCVALRIPSWCKEATATFSGGEIKCVGGKWMKIVGSFCEGARIELRMPMPIRLVRGLKAQEGKVAVMRGPCVYALECEVNGLQRQYCGLWDLNAHAPMVFDAKSHCITATFQERNNKHKIRKLKLTRYCSDNREKTYFCLVNPAITVPDELMTKIVQ